LVPLSDMLSAVTLQGMLANTVERA
jgi:hypothetical protein